MTVFNRGNDSIADLLGTINPHISTIARDFLTEQINANPNVRVVRRKTDIVKDHKNGYAITGILLEHTKKGPKPLLSGRIEIFSPEDYDISVSIIDPSYASQAQALKDRLQQELYR